MYNDIYLYKEDINFRTKKYMNNSLTIKYFAIYHSYIHEIYFH